MRRTRTKTGWILAVAVSLLGASAYPAARAYQRWLRALQVRELLRTPQGGLEYLSLSPGEEEEGREGPDEALEEGAEAPALRTLANRTLSGDPDPRSRQRHLEAAWAESRRWAHLLPGGSTRAPLVAGSWLNLGPTESVASGPKQVDSGRLNGIVVHPKNPDIVYLATAGGGLWKSYDFETAAPNPTWHPVTESLASQAIGAVALDPTDPDLVYVGVGDSWDTTGNAVFKSTTGGGAWGPPAFLSGTYTFPGGTWDATPESIRALAVDPLRPDVVMATTNVGLFRSENGGQSFALVDLPQADGPGLAESMWSLVYLGAQGGQSAWLASGQQACAEGERPPRFKGTGPGKVGETGKPCRFGNKGHLWRSVDGGKSWVSLRDASGLPSSDLGRISLAVGAPQTPSTTVVYAQIGNQEEENTIAIWRSSDGGRTFADASGALTNPSDASYCTDWPDFGHDQAWYNQAIAVDPGDDDQVIVGGQLCGARTKNGTSASPSWESVAFAALGWGSTLNYVHADWHVAAIRRVNGKVRVLVGGDGGLFSATNVFTAAPAAVDWDSHNRGLATHLCYAVGSGDPALGNPYSVLTGLQDNGSRIRDYPRWEAAVSYRAGDLVAPVSANGHLYRADVAGVSDEKEPSWPTAAGAATADGSVIWREAGPIRATAFNEITMGDGFGTAVHKGSGGEWLWSSIQYRRYYCRPHEGNCNREGAWTQVDPTPGPGDRLPFLTWIIPVQSDPEGSLFLTVSERALFKTSTSCANKEAVCWKQVGGQVPGYVRQLAASPTVPGLYGVVLAGGRFAITSDEQSWSVSTPIRAGISMVDYVAFASSLAFPAATPAGTQPGDVYAVSSAASTTVQGSPVKARVFRTDDRGKSWTPIGGNGQGNDLPDVPVRVLRYDPGDSSNQTLYAGTDVGVYRTQDGGATWHRFGYGLPLVAVNDLFISKSSSLMRIATYGRGLWEIWPSASAHRGVAGDGDFDMNGVIDWKDLGALAARLGTSPSTGSWPAYHWQLDSSPPGSANSLDEDDLSRALPHFGGRP